MVSERDESDLQELIGLFGNAEDDATRKQMLTYMKGINPPRGYELLLTLLDKPEQQKHTLRAMLTFRHKLDDATRTTAHQNVVPLLIADDEEVILLAIQVLGRFKHASPTTFDRLLNVINSHDNLEVQLAGLDALPNLIDEVSEKRRKKLDTVLNALWSQLDLDDKLDTAIDTVRAQFDAREAYRARKCVECGRGSDAIELKQCLYCEQFVCVEHVYKGFCTEQHYKTYHYERTGTHNPRYW